MRNAVTLVQGSLRFVPINSVNYEYIYHHKRVQRKWTALMCRTLGASYMMCLCLSYVFGSVLACAKSAHVLLLTLRTLSLTNNSSSDSKAFLRFIAFSGSPTAVHHPLHALWYYAVGIPFWTTCKRQSQTPTEKPQYCVLKSLDHTLPFLTCYGGVYGNIAHEEMADLVAVSRLVYNASNFWT